MTPSSRPIRSRRTRAVDRMYVRRCQDCGTVDLGSAYGAEAREASPWWACRSCGSEGASWLEIASR